ncbi:ribonuclease H-like domain-containing protein [Tanacetum coccineum]
MALLVLMCNKKKKHIEIDIHFVRDLVAAGHVRVLHVPSRYQYADIFTKGLRSAMFEEFRTSLSVRCPPAPTVGECNNAEKRISGRVTPDTATSDDANEAVEAAEGSRMVLDVPEFSYRMVVCRSREPFLDTIMEDPIGAR